jgi:hypothetical protein
MHFARELVFWECREKVASETDVDIPYPDDPMRADPRPLKTFIDVRKRRHLEVLSKAIIPADMRDNEYARTDFYHKWCQFLAAYTKCYLTKGDDLLVALHGIVQDITETLNINIVAGMCTEYLITELCWQSDESQKPRRPPLKFSPSWSWISSTGPVQFAGCQPKFDPLNYSMASVSSVEVDMTPSGELIHASLRLHCGLIPTNHHYDSDFNSYEFALDLKHVPSILGCTEVKLQHDTAVFTHRFQHLQCYFVPLHYENGFKEASWALGMIIVPSEDHPGCYRRVGSCTQYDENRDSDWNKLEVYSAMEKRTIELV